MTKPDAPAQATIDLDASEIESGPEVDLPPIRVGDLLRETYLIRRLIAHGGMGAVYEAEHLYLRRLVAVKVAKLGTDQEERRLRLAREGHVLAMFDHPNVLRALDAGDDAKLGPYIVMEMLNGRSLDSLLSTRKQLDLELVDLVAREMAFALHTLHQRGVIHRDIKPSNLFLVKDALGAPSIRLIDFGIARVFDRDAVPSFRSLTASNQWVGTMEYMAPEQFFTPARGPLLDIYALGMTLYELLSGRLPYEGSPMEVAAAVAQGRESIPLRDLRPDVSEPMANVIAQTMHRDPKQRFQSVRSFANAWSELRAHATSTSTPRPVIQARKFERTPYMTPVRIVSLVDGVGMRDGRTEDISEGGVLAIVREGLPALSEAIVRFAVPTDGRMVQARCRVRWVKGESPRIALGLEFLDLDPGVALEIRRFVEFMLRDGGNTNK